VTLDFLEWLGLVEKKSDVLSGQRFDAEQVTQAVWHRSLRNNPVIPRRDSPLGRAAPRNLRVSSHPGDPSLRSG